MGRWVTFTARQADTRRLGKRRAASRPSAAHTLTRNAVRVPKTHTTRTAPGVHTHRSRAASPSPIHRLATVKEQPQLDRGAQCCADPRVSQRLRLLPSAGKQAED